MHIDNYHYGIVTLLGLAALIAINHWATKATNPRTRIENLLRNAGLTAPLFVHVDKEGLPSAIGEATRNGVRIRFNLSPHEVGARLITTNIIGSGQEQEFLEF